MLSRPYILSFPVYAGHASLAKACCGAVASPVAVLN